MKVPLKWLKEYVDITVPQADLASKLTMAGSEVKGVQVVGGNWENIVIGQIMAERRDKIIRILEAALKKGMSKAGFR